MSEWTISAVDDADVLTENSRLFDHAVTIEGARDFLSRPGHVLLLARASNGTGIGFVSGVEMRHPDKAPEMFIYELGVDDAWRRRGVARALLMGLRDEALRRGCAGMWTGTENDNHPALATYRSVGAKVEEGSVFIVWEDLNADQAG